MSKKSRQDLLVRVRYLNPLPAPPFPPKLFDIPSDIRRLGEPSYLSQLATSAPLPMLVDAEMGMPLDLNQFDGVWDGDDSALNPTSGPAEFDPEDTILLTPAMTEDQIVKQAPQEVSWMRSGNLFMRKMAGKKGEVKPVVQATEMDTSAAAQINAIEATFNDLDGEIRHPDPAKSHLRVAQVYDILPDEETWGVSMHTVRFPERPTAITAALNTASRPTDQLLNNCLIRGLKAEDGSTVFEFYMPENLQEPDALGSLEPVSQEVEERAETLLKPMDNDAFAQEIPHAVYKRRRLYEVVSYKQRGPEERVDELLFAMRKDGARYRTIGSKSNIRKMRAVRQEEMDTQMHWEKIQVGRRRPREDEVESVQEDRKQVTDNTWQAEHSQPVDMGEAIEQDMDE